MIFLLLLAFTSVALIEVPGLVRKRYFRELAVFSFFLLSAFILALLQILGVKLPVISAVTEYLVKDLLHLNYK